MAIVTVDFDGTLYQGDSFKAMFKMGKRHFNWKQWGTVLGGVVKSVGFGIVKGKTALKHEFFKSFASTFKGKTPEELDIFFQELVIMADNEVNHHLVNKIREHQEDGDTVIILSGALRPFLEAFSKRLDLDTKIISTELLYDQNNICTGKIGTIINGDEKVLKVQEWLKDHVTSDGSYEYEIWAYADSESDIPLLHFVEHPIVVNPDQDMKKIAIENQWPIFASELENTV
ncbi:HAD family hydrolase [Evansella tamaricis]|uniref:Haloacid dehalogenase-like hydrolase n=1 Tax=Evansella tamaricis TaxID=2069301 RepID=A0ABS6JH61_9BACI|nr:HAD family hydrolase [Evansella tamaricis]MBU9712569.1 haloacid dehalogenase-like hydrolase [Evansella tamaricis]